MKNLLYSLSIVSLFAMTSCQKEEMFNGTNSITGRVLFQNEVNRRIDTATSGTVHIKQDGTGEEYEVKVGAKGQYEIKFLNEGTFEVHAEYKQVLGLGNDFLLYGSDTTFAAGKDEIVEWNPILRWKNNSTSLRILVTDSTTNSSPIVGANVYLYTTAYLMVSDTNNSSAGSIRTAVSNANGEVLFSGLQAQTYYYRVRAQFGQFTLDNIGGDTSAVTVPMTLSSDTASIE